MSVASLLEKIQKRGQVVRPSQAPQKHVDSKKDDKMLLGSRDKSESPALQPSRPAKPVDPVVARLKEARRKEQEQKEASRKLVAAKQQQKPSMKPSRNTSTQTTPKATERKAKPQTNVNQHPPSTAAAPRKKVNYKDLMKKASAIDNTKLSLNIKAKTLPTSQPPTERRQRSSTGVSVLKSKEAAPKLSRNPLQRQQGQNLAGLNSQNSYFSRLSKPAPSRRGPLPMRGPSAKLSQSLQLRNDEAGDDEDSDMSSFLASEDEEQSQDYDRDEIWAMFNRGKKRSHFDRDDYDSDDMEATGAEIWEEETQSKRTAEMEDRRELAEEQRLREIKRKRREQKERK